MLRQRVITAALLLLFLIPALAARGVWPFASLTLLMIGAAGWEWGRLNGLAFGPALGLGIFPALAGAVALLSGWALRAPAAGWWAASACWVGSSCIALRQGPVAWPALPQPARLLAGVLMLWVAWLALVAAKSLGLEFILSVFCLVWMADMAAYFGGRSLGRHKLASSISPGKSWEGVVAGVLGVVLLTAVWLLLGSDRSGAGNSVFAIALDRLGPAGLALALGVLTALSVVGDLMESLVKRAAGVKDSSSLLPGHGGVLDRVDALLPVFPAAMALASLRS